MECVRLRVQDIDWERSLIYVRAAKGGKDRTTVLAKALQGELRLHIEKVRRLHEEDLSKGFGEVFLPSALSRKYPRAGREFRWQYVFPSKRGKDRAAAQTFPTVKDGGEAIPAGFD